MSLGVWRKDAQALGFASAWFLGNSRTPPPTPHPANVLEAATGHALAKAPCLTEATT